MTHTHAKLLVALSLPLALGATAAADTGVAQTPSVRESATKQRSFGMRVGGWGFRDPDAQSVDERWRDCRMNGLGVFGQQQITKHAFIEAGTDLYFSDNTVLGSVDHGPTDHPSQSMDRLSGLLTVAGGLSTKPLSRLTLYTQLGVGLEWTSVKISAPHMHPDYASDDPLANQGQDLQATRVMPVGFFGLGGDIRVMRNVHVGASFRTMIMGHFGHHEVTEIDAEPEAANHGQFYLRFDI